MKVYQEEMLFLSNVLQILYNCSIIMCIDSYTDLDHFIEGVLKTLFEPWHMISKNVVF